KTIRCRKAEQKHGLYKELISTSPIDLSKERLNESGEDRVQQLQCARSDLPDSSKAPNPRKDGDDCGDIPTEDSIPLSPIKIQKGRILKAEENSSATELVAADDLPKLSEAAGNEDTNSDVDGNLGSHEALPTSHPMPGTSFQATSNSPKSRFVGPSNRTYTKMSGITSTQVLSTFEPVELKNTQATALPQYRTDEEMCQYYIHCYKHLALDITEPPAPNKSKKAGTSHNNSDEAITGEEEKDDGEERIETTCLTWQSAVESTMDELKRLIRMSDKPLKVPKDYLCAAEQFRAFKEFQQDTEALMLR
ncbi:MAG: hypothetical protein M1835_004135, partial [Candelina submexicana]